MYSSHSWIFLREISEEVSIQTASSFKAKNLTAKDIQSISGVIPDDVIKRIDKVLSTS
jgi:hypothetical protein